MHSLDVSQQNSWSREGFFTRVTFVISLSFMKWFDVIDQASWWSKRFFTRITFVIFLSFMEYLDMFLQTSRCSKRFSTNVTFETRNLFMIICIMRSQLALCLSFRHSDKSYIQMQSIYWNNFYTWKYNSIISNVKRRLLLYR